MAKQCTACGGVYEPLGADGVAYYHVCPPVTRVPVLRAGVAQLVDLAAVKLVDVVVVQRAGAKVQVAVALLAPGDVRLGDVHVERPDHRDETIVPAVVAGVVVGVPKAGGAGAKDVVVVPPDPLAVFKGAVPP